MVEYHREVCPQCGNLRSVCSDPDIDWHPNTSVCWPSATSQWALRHLQAKYADETPGSGALHPLDGLSVWPSREDYADPEFADPSVAPESERGHDEAEHGDPASGLH